jgi:coenzyme PQQ biosynthesis protein PqqD
MENTRPDPRSEVSLPAMIPPFTTSPATDEFYDTLLALHEHLFRVHIVKIWGWHKDFQRELFRSNWETCDTSVVLSNGELIGYLQLLRQPDHFVLKNLGLLPSHQGSGIGAALIKELQAEAASLRMPIKLSVFATNPRAQRFYERAGFVNESSTSEFRHMRWEMPPSAVVNAEPGAIASRPTLAPGVRLQMDAITGEPVLLYPEGIMALNSTAHEIVARCDGATTVGAIAAALAAEYEISHDALDGDVLECLEDLHRRRLIIFAA